MSPHPQSKKARAAKARRTAARRIDDRDRSTSKQDARLRRQLEQRHWKERRKRLRQIRNAVLGLVAIAVIGGGGWLAFRPGPELAGVTRPANRGGGHVTAASYGSATPTSGAHDARAPQCGTYREPLEPALAVHGLEHGAVVLWFDAARPELADQLERATDEWDSHVIISANDALPQPVVAAAWNRLKAYDAGDPDITEFVRTYRRRGPEREPCDR